MMSEVEVVITLVQDQLFFHQNNIQINIIIIIIIIIIVIVIVIIVIVSFPTRKPSSLIETSKTDRQTSFAGTKDNELQTYNTRNETHSCNTLWTHGQTNTRTVELGREC